MNEIINKYFLLLIAVKCASISCEQQPKIALVKQVVYPGLYCVPNRANINETIFSSSKHAGMVALFTKHNADFHIVEVEKDEECQVWYEKVTHCQQPKSYYESLSHSISNWGKISGNTVPQGVFAKRAEDIDWGQYDIVFSIDIAVPARITRKYPQTLWAYYIGEGCQPTFKSSLEKIVDGYDIYLTQDFFEKRKLQNHVIDCPYFIQYYGCFHELLPDFDKPSEGIYLETHTAIAIKPSELEQLNSITSVKLDKKQISTRQMAENYMSAKYFILYVDPQSGVRSLVLGNACIQAIASGALVIAGRKNIRNKDILTDKTLVNSFDELCQTLRFFEENPQEYEAEVTKQRKLVDRLCYERPMQMLFDRLHEKRNKIQ